jgi:hypothetical protein
MKIKFVLPLMGSALLLAAPALPAQNTITNTNSLPLTQTVKYQEALAKDRSLGEQSLFPPGLKEKLKLTKEQRADLEPIEADFAQTVQEYQAANQPRIEAALAANRRAREAKDNGQIQDARKQLQAVWAGLQKYRDSAVEKTRPLLTPDQITILDDAKNQWHENHVAEANDPSAN